VILTECCNILSRQCRSVSCDRSHDLHDFCL